MKRLLCYVLGHRYVLERRLGFGARKVGCTRCRKHWAMHDSTRSLLDWDQDFENLYAPDGILAKAYDDVNSLEHSLLVALKVVLRDYKAVHGTGDLEMQPALHEAHTAIAKAEGVSA